MLRTLAAGLVAFLWGVAAYPLLISALYRSRVGQPIREEGPPSHLRKVGTPTAGGVLFILVALVMVALFDREVGGALLALALVLGALLGAIDDYQKYRAGRNLGLRARHKIVVQAAVGAALGYLLYRAGFAAQYVPGRGLVQLGTWIVPLAALAIVATSNAVNLTDGSDGLAAGLAVLAFGILAAVSVGNGQVPRAIALAGLTGALLAFLWYNAPPARLFMGDTGSLALGTALATAAIVARLLWLLPLLGLVFLVETLTVIIQVVAFKSTGRRVFRMSPLHNHFELMGWREGRIVMLFWAAGALSAILVLLLAPRGGVLR
jgi:phospho-N-acetylmuramoyl-pentapeptide-transferase